MTKYYSKTTGGFYDDAINSSMPNDAKLITDQQWQNAMTGQSQGKIIQSDATGIPQCVDSPIASNDLLWRDYQASAQLAMNKSDITVIRCVESAIPLPSEWVAYRKNLRAILGSAKGDFTKPLPAIPSYP